MADKNYHHGDLRSALVQAARTILERDGLAALTLRACAREAGVSHAAPLHHFPNLAELLAAVAASGFGDFVKALDEHTRQVADPYERLTEMGIAYVRFASANQALYSVMFGADMPRVQSETLLLAMRAAWDQLYGAVASAAGAGQALSNAALLWTVVHGHATLVATRCMPPMLVPDIVLRSSLNAVVAGIRANQLKS
ncbi:MAG: TetR/AcrR family transcriptional regulator [Rhizobiaceae bacterium]